MTASDDSAPDPYSFGGFMTALFLAAFAEVAGPDYVAAYGGAVALGARSLMGPLTLGRGLALWLGGQLAVVILLMDLSGASPGAGPTLILAARVVCILLIPGPLLWFGFRRPR